MWYVIGYLVVAFIVLGMTIDMGVRAEKTRNEFYTSLFVGLLWPLVVLMAIGAIIVDKVAQDDTNNDQ